MMVQLLKYVCSGSAHLNFAFWDKVNLISILVLISSHTAYIRVLNMLVLAFTCEKKMCNEANVQLFPKYNKPLIRVPILDRF